MVRTYVVDVLQPTSLVTVSTKTVEAYVEQWQNSPPRNGCAYVLQNDATKLFKMQFNAVQDKQRHAHPHDVHTTDSIIANHNNCSALCVIMPPHRFVYLHTCG